MKSCDFITTSAYPDGSVSRLRHSLFDSFKAKVADKGKRLPIPKKPPLRAVPVPKKESW